MLDIGRASLHHQDAKPYTHDLLLSMALAEVINVNKEVGYNFIAALLCTLFL